MLEIDNLYDGLTNLCTRKYWFKIFYLDIDRYIWLATWWIIFGVVHSFFATDAVKRLAGNLMKSRYRYYRVLYSIFATIILVVVLWLNFSIELFLLWQPLVFEIIVSVIIGIIGLMIMAICARKYFFDLSGINVFFKKSPDEHLQVTGLNKYVRHPLYTGTLLFIWSFFFLQPAASYLISALCITIYTVVGAHFEEKTRQKIWQYLYGICWQGTYVIAKNVLVTLCCPQGSFLASIGHIFSFEIAGFPSQFQEYILLLLKLAN